MTHGKPPKFVGGVPVTRRQPIDAADALTKATQQIARQHAHVKELKRVLNNVLQVMEEQDTSPNKESPWIPGHAAKPLREEILNILGVKK